METRQAPPPILEYSVILLLLTDWRLCVRVEESNSHLAEFSSGVQAPPSLSDDLSVPARERHRLVQSDMSLGILGCSKHLERDHAVAGEG